jgi:hypothetical protein
VVPLAVESTLTNLATQVLACGIVGTIGLGLIKLSYDKHRLRKYSNVDKGKWTQSSKMLEAQPVTEVTEETEDEIPFGIRAIQSGIEVDGVWISRGNIPVGSSWASIMSEKIPHSSKTSQFKPSQSMGQGSSRNNLQAPCSFDRIVTAEWIHYHVSRNSAALNALELPRSTRTSRPPFREFFYTSCLHYADFTIVCHTQQYQTGQFSKQSSRRTSGEPDYMAIGQDVRAYETAYFRPSSTQAPIDPRTDLELLRSHRLFHVAETGQLTPRVRKPGNGGEWASAAENQVASVNGINHSMLQKTFSPPLPIITDPSEKIGVASTDGPSHDGNAANQASSAMPLTEPYVPNAPYSLDTYKPRRL